MKVLFILFFGCFILFEDSFGQLKENNFILIDSLSENIKSDKISEKGSKFFQINKTSFKYEKDLTFIYSINYDTNFCCNYYEVKSIPKDWNIVSVKDVVAHMEDKTMGFSFKERKLFFVEYEVERKIYKAYQADIIGWPRED